jgi:hypothetical protein
MRRGWHRLAILSSLALACHSVVGLGGFQKPVQRGLAPEFSQH